MTATVYADACTRGDWPGKGGGWGLAVQLRFADGTRREVFARAPWSPAWQGADNNLREYAATTYGIVVALRLVCGTIVALTDNNCSKARYFGRTSKRILVGSVLRHVVRWAEDRAMVAYVAHMKGTKMPADGISRGPQVVGPILPPEPPWWPADHPTMPAIGAAV